MPYEQKYSDIPLEAKLYLFQICFVIFSTFIFGQAVQRGDLFPTGLRNTFILLLVSSAVSLVMLALQIPAIVSLPLVVLGHGGYIAYYLWKVKWFSIDLPWFGYREKNQ